MTVLDLLSLFLLVAGVLALVRYVRHDSFRGGASPYRDELGMPLTRPRH